MHLQNKQYCINSLKRLMTATSIGNIIAKAEQLMREVCAASACVHSLRHSLTMVRRLLSEWHHTGYT